MTFGKAAALTASLVGAMAFGVWVGPYITDRAATLQSSQPAISEPAAEKTDVAAPVRKAAKPRAAIKRTDNANTASVQTVSVSAPRLHQRLKPLLNRGADMAIVSQGFKSAEDLAATVHAARNVDVPFMLLKHRIVDQGKSLTAAIRETKPDVNAEKAAAQARAQAREDLGGIS